LVFVLSDKCAIAVLVEQGERAFLFSGSKIGSGVVRQSSDKKTYGLQFVPV